MAKGVKLRSTAGALQLNSTDCIGWRLYEAFVVGETESSSKDYSALIAAEHTLFAMVAPSYFLAGSHTVSVSGKVVSWAPFTLTMLGPTNQNAPSTIYVFYK